MLERAIQIAVEAHMGQVDKGGSLYILHPLRVMMNVDGALEKTVAVLHDVVEDSEWTFETLEKEGFPIDVIDALRSVTKVDASEKYELFIQRALLNPIGRRVKIADLRDNLDVTRITRLTEKDLERLNKYKQALIVLEKP
jgi:(p)ppGpp synthase/HD superfamily hydrolase